MSTPTPPPPLPPRSPQQKPKPKQPRSRLASCALAGAAGCGVILVVVVVAAFAAGYWALQSGEQAATTAVVSPASQGAVHSGNLAEDEGATALVVHTILASQRAAASARPDDLPPALRSLREAQMSNADPSMVMPRSFTLSWEPEADGETVGWVLAVNPRMMTRLLFFLFSTGMKDAADYREIEVGDHTIHATPEVAMARHGGTILAASSAEILGPALERIVSGAPPPAPVLMRVNEAIDGRDLGAVIGADTPAFARLMADLSATEREALSGLRDITFAVDIVSEDRLDVQLTLTAADLGAAERLAAGLERAITEQVAKGAERGLEIVAVHSSEGTEARADLQISGVAGAIEVAMSEAMARDRERDSL